MSVYIKGRKRARGGEEGRKEDQAVYYGMRFAIVTKVVLCLDGS